MARIERANITKAEEIARLNLSVQELHVKAHPNIFKSPGNEEDLKQFFEKLLNDDNNYFYLAYISEEAVGYIWVQLERRPENPLIYESSRLYIHHLSVGEKHRRNGVGLALMKAVEKLAEDVGIRIIALDTWSFNREAQIFFKHQGFETYNVQMWKNLF